MASDSSSKMVNILVKTLSGEIFSLECVCSKEPYEVASTLQYVYPDSFSFIPKVIRDEKNDEYFTDKYGYFRSTFLEEGEMLYIVPNPADYGATIQHLADNIQLHFSESFMKHFSNKKEYLESGSISLYESIIHCDDFYIYFPFLVHTSLDGKKMFAPFMWDLIPINDCAIEIFDDFMQKVKEYDAYLRPYRGWKKIMDEYQPMIQDNDYIHLRMDNFEFMESGCDLSYRDGFLYYFYEYFLPDDDRRDDFPVDNADVTYSNQFLFVPFKNAIKEYFQNP